MLAYDMALSRYDDELDLSFILAKCARTGWIHVDKDVLVAACPCSRAYVTTGCEDALDIDDSWYIYIASGNLSKAFDIIPKKEWIVFERFDGKIRSYNFERMRRLLWAER